MAHVTQVFDALMHVSPNIGAPSTPGSRFEGYLRFMNYSSDKSSQTEEEEQSEAGGPD